MRNCQTVSKQARDRQRGESPSVTFYESAAGRETLSAIAGDRADARHPYAYRGPASTRYYGDRISNAPGAMSPRTARALDGAPEISVWTEEKTRARPRKGRTPRPGQASAPDLSVHLYRAQQATLLALGLEPETSARPEHSDLVARDEQEDALQIERFFSFVVSRPVSRFAVDPSARAQLARRLLPHMPGVRWDDIVSMTTVASGDTETRVDVRVRLNNCTNAYRSAE